MKKKKLTIKKILSMLMVFALLITCLPMSAKADETDPARVADASTMDGWKKIFLPDILSTENAGGVWTDKSVFTDAAAFAGTGIVMEKKDNFLVALSAIASNIIKEGMSSSPTDTMLILDVSGSMNDNEGNNDVAEELVEAANESIAALLSANKYNRVGVVVYSGPAYKSDPATSTDAILLLPLGRYETGTDGAYLSYILESNKGSTTESISLDKDITYEGTNAKPSSKSKSFFGATYIQKGVILAMNQFTDASNATTVTDSVLGTLKRKPIMVLMSDGAPTVSSTNFMSPSSYNLGDGTSDSTSAAQGFVTQLSAAYAKQQIEAKYNMDALFYTLGLGVTNNTVATSVLNPTKSSTAINEFWTKYNNASVNGTVTVQGSGKHAKSVTKISETIEQNYVDEYFAVDGSTEDLAQGLKDAFQDIVGKIQLQSKYFPTLISESEEHSGYISFVDRVGEYMEVKDVKGILIHNTLFSGAELASNFAEGEDALDIYAESVIGNEMIHAVQQRLGIDDGDDETEDDLETARTLIKLAHAYGQLSYKNANEYSNYIGWYSNAAGEFLGFYQEGVTELKATDNTGTNPVFTVKSYGYFGKVDEEQGVAKTDMMFATVQVRTNIQTGEQIVTFAIPAALVPIVTYHVTLDGNKNLSDLKATGAEHPIRLVYEVGLDEGMNEYTINDLVSPEYLAENTNVDGSVNFYTNQYEHSNTTGYNRVNTYSYFNPSRQNEKYYHLEDTPIYADDKGTLYSGDTKPTGDMYRFYTVYKKDGTKLITDTVYRKLDPSVLAGAVQTEGTTNWHIPKGYVHVNTEGYTIDKSPNTTNTLPQANIPFVDTHNHKPGDLGYHFYIGATLGNNGKLTLVPETGIKITKEMKEDATAPDAPFTFVLTNMSDTADDTQYPAYLILADGTTKDTTVTFKSGKATVTLNPKDTLYIGGMTEGEVITVEETETADYIVDSVNNDSTIKIAAITLVAKEFAEAYFVNADRGKGNLTIAKEVEHDFGLDYQIPADRNFEITVTLSGVGTANATYTASQTNSTITSVTTDHNGQFTITLKHDEQFQVFGLPEGTQVTVVENNPGTGFVPQYWDKGVLGDGKVAIEGDTTVSVIVINDYTSAKVYPVNITVSGTKTLTGRQWNTEDVFTFELQKQTGENQWTVLGTATVKGTDTDKVFDFNSAFAKEEYAQAGTYYYRVVEIEPTEGVLGGVTYDKSVHAFAVDVADADMDGKLEISKVRAFRTSTGVTQPDSNSWHVDVDFVNSYAASGKATVTIDLNKKVTNESGSSLASLGGFTFGLFDASGNKVYESEPTTDRGFARFVLDFTQTGTYTYTLKEIHPDKIPAGWTYSTTEIPVTIEVTDTGEGHYAAVVYEGIQKPDNAGTSLSTEFINVYQPKEAELTIDFVDKLISGRTLKADEFTFEVQKNDGTTVLKGTNDAKGNVNFDGTLKFHKVDTYNFNIVETSADGKGVTTDKTVYRILVTVIDNAGELSASYVLLNAVGDDIVFQNTYKADKVTYQIGGNKILKGRTLLNDEFVFVMTEVVDAKGNALSGAKTYETTNLIDGSFVFEEITYTETGIHYYLVSEKANSGNTHGIVYDKTEFIVTVEITDNGEGKLEVSKVSYVIKGNGSANNITFVNEYVPSPTSAQIPGNKDLTGKVLSGDDFEFELYDSDENWTEGDKRETVKNAKDGSFVFETIDYDKAGYYYYLVKEVNGGKVIDGITYDATVYRVRIDVTDDLKGNLKATLHIYDQYDIPQESIIFENIYEITGTGSVTLEGEKTLNGRDITDGEFTFELYETDEEFAVYGTAKDTAVNVGEKFDFSITYTVEDVGKTFYYVVKEANAGKIVDGILYSTAEYHITIVVEDNGVGGIKTTKTIKNGTISVSSLDFTNECVGDLVITKDVDFIKDGKEITASLDNREDKVYTFTVTFGDGTIETFTLKNGESKTFEDIVYGTTYTVAEDTTGAVFTNVVTAGTGTIEAATTNVTVTNTYDYKTRVNAGFNAIKVDKETNEPLGGAEFTLYSDEACENAVATVTSDATGKVHFDITEEGTYYLKETKAPEGYYVSDVVYVIKAVIQYVEILEGEHAPYIEERMLITAEELKGVTEDDITFEYFVENTPVNTVEVSVEKKWVVPEGITIPETLEVVLYKDGEVYETVQLSANGNWSYTWIDLSEEHTWTVDEVKVPYSFTKKVESNGNNFTITNTYTETIKDMGDNLMPKIFAVSLLLAGFGVVFTTVVLRRKEETE